MSPDSLLSSDCSDSPSFSDSLRVAASRVPRAIARGTRLALIVASLSALALGSGCQTDFESRLAQIRVLQDAGEFNSSIEPLRLLLHTEPKHPEANYRLGIAPEMPGAAG